MCEMMIIRPEKYSNESIVDAIMDIYTRMGDGLGIIALKSTPEGKRFDQRVYKAENPSRKEVKIFTKYNNSVDLLFVHGRLATSGNVGEEQTHPIKIDCNKCDIDRIMHNGVALNVPVQTGHNINTSVDTEELAHYTEEVPKKVFEKLPAPYQRQSAVALFNDRRVFVMSSYKYRHYKNGEMATYNIADSLDRQSEKGFGDGGSSEIAQMVITPEVSEEMSKNKKEAW